MDTSWTRFDVSGAKPLSLSLLSTKGTLLSIVWEPCYGYLSRQGTIVYAEDPIDALYNNTTADMAAY